MNWVWIGLVTGAVIAPWVTMGRPLFLAFRRGPIVGFGTWFGMAIPVTAITLAVMWIGHWAGLY